MPARLAGKTVLITSGPTREHLDPIRFLTNASSGRMGAALAREARRLGARVLVVLGPGAERPRRSDASTVDVISAAEMKREVLRLAGRADVVIGAAAVCDWRFARTFTHKISKGGTPRSVKLLPNDDIIAGLGRRRAGRPPLVVGFALETRDVERRAFRKLRQKNLDLIVANGPAALGGERSSAVIFDRGGPRRKVGPARKSAVAKAVFEEIAKVAEAAR